MTVVSVLGDTAVVVLGTLTVACFIGIVIASVLVTGAVHTEERHRTLTGPPPGPCTELARRLLAVPPPAAVTNPAPGSDQDPRHQDAALTG